nr:MAG TPA: hypothetical protein [Caudoviricetes sp.]
MVILFIIKMEQRRECHLQSVMLGLSGKWAIIITHLLLVG